MKNLQEAVLAVMRKQVTEAPIKHPNQKELDVAEPKGELTSADFKKLRAMKKEETELDEEQLDELSADTLNSYMKKKRKEIGKYTVGDSDRLRGTPKGKEMEKAVDNYRKAWAKRDMKEEAAEENIEAVNETIIYHNSFDIGLKDEYVFSDFLDAAKALSPGEENVVSIANEAFRDGDISIILEAFSNAAIEDKVRGHMKAGHKVSMPKFSTKSGMPRAEYVVTDKESGVRRKYIHHGNVTKMENMGAPGKRG